MPKTTTITSQIDNIGKPIVVFKNLREAKDWFYSANAQKCSAEQCIRVEYALVKDQNGNVINNSATANVTVTFGVVSEVEVVNQGSGYLDSQEVFLNGFPGVKLQVSVINPTITYDTTRTATVINYTAGETVDGSASTVRYLYVQLDDPANPITTSTPITTSRGITHNVTTDDLINAYQQINVGDEFEYNF